MTLCQLQVVILEVGTEEGSAKLAEYLKSKFGHVDYAVSCLGAWWQGGALPGPSEGCHSHQGSSALGLGL